MEQQTCEILRQIKSMKNYEDVEGLWVIYETALEQMGRIMSDLRAARNQELVDLSSEIFEDLPEVNCIVLRASLLDGKKKWVYGFAEITGSRFEGRYFDELDENLVSLNYWLTENGQSTRPNGLSEKLERLCELNLDPIPDEFDWDDIENGGGVEVLLVQGGKTYFFKDEQL